MTKGLLKIAEIAHYFIFAYQTLIYIIYMIDLQYIISLLIKRYKYTFEILNITIRILKLKGLIF